MAQRDYAPWVIAHDGSGVLPANTLECLRCDLRATRPLPMSVSAWLLWARGFREIHGRCQPKPPRLATLVLP